MSQLLIKPILKNNLNHQFHLVDISPLPFFTASVVGLLAAQLAFFFHSGKYLMPIILLTLLFATLLIKWFITVIEESGEGYHSVEVYQGLRYGMAFFIVSEVLFFFAFFWAFFHVSLSPSLAIACVWPPITIQPLDIWGLPLTNTILLLTSGLTLTLAHYDLLVLNKAPRYITMENLMITVLLGITFLFCQFIEYQYGITFSWKENIYGSTFFVTTGFHGFHVIIGTVFLLVCFFRLGITNILLGMKYSRVTEMYNWVKIHAQRLGEILNREICETFNITWKDFEFTRQQHLGFEAAAWYWHFVDIVWIFLFLTIYWWGSTNLLS